LVGRSQKKKLKQTGIAFFYIKRIITYNNVYILVLVSYILPGILDEKASAHVSVIKNETSSVYSAFE